MNAQEGLPGHRYFMLVGSTLVGSLLISNIAAQKLIPIGPFVFTGGILLFPVTYIFGDILTEVYGYAKARQVIWAGFAANAFMAAFLALVVKLPPAQGWELQEEFAATFRMVPRVVLGSILGFWSGEFSNSYVLAKMKVWTKGRALWSRTIGSTIVGQAVDTAVFLLVAFVGELPIGLILKTLWSAYLFKVAYEAVATPWTYWIVKTLKRKEGVDVFDRETNFTPFSLETNEESHPRREI